MIWTSLGIEEPEFLYHLPPDNDSRLVQRPRGYRWIMVNGEVTFEDGKKTKAYSGAVDTLWPGNHRPTLTGNSPKRI